MISAARTLIQESTANGGKVVICKDGPSIAMEQALMWSGKALHIETVATLSEALQTCMAELVDHLVINMFSFTSSELTALAFFRQMRPEQHVVVFCREENTAMVWAAGLADECYPVKVPAVSRNETRHART
jgi:hypothetical protein